MKDSKNSTDQNSILAQSNTQERTTLDVIEEMNACATQTKSLLCTLIANDHFKDMHPEIISNVLWLAEDRMGDMLRLQDEVVEIMSKQGVLDG